ncbi:MAG: uroporphyrinogen decarboxylase family protein [Chloroflexota bacterium]|nr:uroporphyrinogen decarboxylase family protein [Chloroflexota bacterium]
MNSRERVLTALRRTGTSDRVPLQFDLCRSLLEKFGEKYDIPVHYTAAYYEDVTYRLSANELRVAMGSDCVMVGASLPRGYEHPVDEDGYLINEFNMKLRQGPIYVEVVSPPPMSHFETPADVEEFEFPDPLAEGRFDDAKMYIEKYKDEYFIIGDMELTTFDMMHLSVGMEKLLIDMALEKPYIEPLIQKTKDFSLAIGNKLVSMGVDGVWAGDDFGGQSGMLISPKMWRKYFKESYREIYAELRAINPDVVIMQHCDGAVAPILGDWIEVGLEVFNPVQPNVPGHEPEDLKGKYGDSLSFWGAIDQQHLLPNGVPEDIETDVAEKIRVLGKGGGYMCAPAHIVQADTSMENVEAFIAAVKKHGVYQ